MTPIIEIFSQGEEIVSGQVADTNAAWLSQQLLNLGFEISRHNSVGDKLNDLVGLLKEIAQRADCCICSGGLGPTCDDLTAEAVAIAFDLPLEFDNEAYQHIEQYFLRRQRQMPESNTKQALLPQGAMRLDNDWGTAPGFALRYGRCWFAFVAGVPSEMRALFQHRIQPLLLQQFSVVTKPRVTLRSFGIGESEIQHCLNRLAIDDNIQLGFRTTDTHIETKLVFPTHYPLNQQQSLVHQINEALDGAVFNICGLGKPEQSLLEVVQQLLTERQQTVAMIETLSHGLLASQCWGQSWLKTSIIGINAQHFGLEEDFIDPEDVAEILRQQNQVDFGLLQYYQSSDEVVTDKNQSITLYNILSTADGIFRHQEQIGGSLQRKQNRAALSALDFLRRTLPSCL